MRLNPEARALYRNVREEIKRRLLLPGSVRFLDEFKPTSDPEEILRRQAYLREGLGRVSPRLSELIGRVRPIKFRRDYLHDRILIVDPEEVEEAEKLGLCSVSTSPVFCLNIA